MSHISQMIRSTLFILAFFSMLPFPQAARAQDLVASEDIAGGSSVFVFRESHKKPQARSGGGGGVTAGSGRARAARTNAQIAAAARRRRAAAVAARKRAIIAAANRKIALSNTLTAKAEEFLDNNQTDLAITNYRDALVQYPQNKRASEGLSNALTAKGLDVAGDKNNEAAIPFFTEAVKYDKQNDVAYAKLGAIYDSAGKKDVAIANYEAAIAVNPENVVLYPPLGILYIDSGEIAKAENCLQKANAAGIDNVETRFLRAMVLFKQNKNSEALAAFDRTLELDGNYVAAQYYRGQTLDRLDKTDQAIAAYQKTIELEPSNSAATFDLGVDYYNKGDYNSAATAYQRSIAIDGSNSQAHANLASTYRQLERYPDANAEYKIAANGMKTADLYSEWGYSLGKAGEWDNAVIQLKTAEEISPDAIDNSNIGWAYYNAGNSVTALKNGAAAKVDYEIAKTFLKKAIEQDAKLDAAYLNLGSTHNAIGEFQLAVDTLKVAVGLHQNWTLALNQLGFGYRGLKDLNNAIATFNEVITIDGRNTFGLYSLGEAYFSSGNKKEAKKISERLRRIDPALSLRLDNVIAGRVIDAAKQKIEQKVPRIPRFP